MSSPSSNTRQCGTPRLWSDEAKVHDFDARRLINAAGDAIIALSPAGTLIAWNSAAERLFGWPIGEALGRSLDLIIPEESRDAHWRGFRRVMKSGQTRLGKNVIRVPALHKDGHQIRIALTVAVLRDANGHIEALGAIIREDSTT